ncbi:CocE/NonD family hydrolase [Streptomyces sp. NBC_01429]|uniref:CocE/NonD family hydrolase n=1 Tax=Streptomyces sp. NBC_01429 TaxID=2903862 RepID=UPI002E29E44D|nr:CocE/NonD family hydrolase [Streptomyces sp. NBC_01429]
MSIRLPAHTRRSAARRRPGRRPRTRIATVLALVLAVAAALLGAAPAPPSGPEPAPSSPVAYDVAARLGVPVTLADGTVLRGDVYTPAVAGTATPAAGPFPVLLVQTPYGRAAKADELAYFVRRGYVAASVDVRGTGSSTGSWSPFAPVEARDGAALVDWAAALPHSDGEVGLYGDSYTGINQISTAAAVGPGSPVKAIFPVVAGNDLYRDLVTMGGLPNAEFMPLWLLYTGLGNLTNPILSALMSGSTQNLLDTLSLVLQHLGGVASANLPILTGLLTGGEEAYDGDFWQRRRPADQLAGVVANGVPAFLVGGWYDLFQRGALMNYAGLQNAWAGRPAGAPMTSDQQVTDRYQLLMGPWYHDPRQEPEFDLSALQLRWYDHWLKGLDTGIAGAPDPNPLHVKELGSDRWLDTRSYPFAGADPTRLYLGKGRTGTAAASANDGLLTPALPASDNSEFITWTSTISSCTRSTAQWIGGFVQDPACTESNTARESGPNSLVYTTAPMDEARTIAGPIGATLYAQANTNETQFVVTVTDVAPDGSSVPLTTGALAGSHRTVDPARSWYAPDGSYLMPYHPSTRESTAATPAFRVARYDLEIFPTFAAIAAGHRVRVVVTTADTPHLAPTLSQSLNLLAGIYQVKEGPSAPSSVTIPLAPASAFATPCTEVCP